MRRLFNLFLISCLISTFLFLTACKSEFSQQNVVVQDDSVSKCIALCQEEKNKGTDLSNGPCLSTKIIDDWVCDVAHSPRQEVDNNPQNQCETFRNGEAYHFVEVDENCNFIKKY